MESRVDPIRSLKPLDLVSSLGRVDLRRKRLLSGIDTDGEGQWFLLFLLGQGVQTWYEPEAPGDHIWREPA